MLLEDENRKFEIAPGSHVYCEADGEVVFKDWGELEDDKRRKLWETYEDLVKQLKCLGDLILNSQCSSWLCYLTSLNILA